VQEIIQKRRNETVEIGPGSKTSLKKDLLHYLLQNDSNMDPLNEKEVSL